MRASEFFDTLTFEGNSREMVEAVLRSVPRLFRKRLFYEIRKYVRDRNVTVVTEELIFDAVREFAPQTLIDRYLPDLLAMRAEEEKT